jgi:hypothetical protein
MCGILMGFVFPQNSEDLKSITHQHHPGSRYGQKYFRFHQLTGMLVQSIQLNFSIQFNDRQAW